MKNPNWKEEELKLALELYLSKDLTWLSKMRDSTMEIDALSQLLNQLDLIPKSDRGKKFRSCGSVRMKLSNFKALDQRYGKSSLSNIGSLDKKIWNEYSNRHSDLFDECCFILHKHYTGKSSDELSEYLNRYDKRNNILLYNEFRKFAKETYSLAAQFKSNILLDNTSQMENKIIDTCSEIMRSLEWYLSDGEKVKYFDRIIDIKEHGGINQVPVNASYEKIGKYVQNTMEKLISERKITKDVLKDLTSRTWSKDCLHLNHPFLIKVDSHKNLKEQICDCNGYTRYWKKVHLIEGENYCICKEWYESGRKFFDKWVDEINKKQHIDMTKEQLLSTLKFIKTSDEKSISIKREELFTAMKGVVRKEEILEQFIEMGVLIGFQGTERELVVDDYELLYEMINHPEKYS